MVELTPFNPLYRYHLVVNSAETGLQITPFYIKGCDWSLSSSSFHSVNRTRLSQSKGLVNISRCGLGNPANKGIELVVTNPLTGGTEEISLVPNLLMARHRPNSHKIAYYSVDKSEMRAFTAIDGGFLLQDAMYTRAATPWNGPSGVLILRALENEEPNVLVKGTPVDSSAHCPIGAYGCVDYDLQEISLGGGRKKWVIPNPVDMYIRINPTRDTFWTDNYRDSLVEGNRVVYLPDILAHEFGHTLGLGHSSKEGAVMQSGQDPTRQTHDFPTCDSEAESEGFCGLHKDDKQALKALYD